MRDLPSTLQNESASGHQKPDRRYVLVIKKKEKNIISVITLSDDPRLSPQKKEKPKCETRPRTAIAEIAFSKPTMSHAKLVCIWKVIGWFSIPLTSWNVTWEEVREGREVQKVKNR